MTALIAHSLSLAALAVAVFAGWHTAKGYRFSNPLLYAMGALEIALVAALVGGGIALARTDRDVEGVLFISYLLTVAVIPVAAVFWGIGDKTRWGTGVVAVALVTVSVLMIRILQIWTRADV